MRRMIFSVAFTYFTWCLLAAAAWAGESKEMFIIQSSQKTPDEVVMNIERYARDKNWVFLGSNKVKKGQIRLVKICIRAAGKELWKAGLHVSAMAPCGNVGVYGKDGATQISLLHPHFMFMIYPNPNVKKAVEISGPLLLKMMDDLN